MILLLLIFLATFLLYVFFFRNGKSRHYKELANKIPGPPVVPIFGNGLAISRNPKGALDYLCEASKIFGPVTRHWIGNHMYVYITDPKDIEILLRDSQNIKKSSTYDYVKPWLGEGLVTSTGEHWHVHRKSITPAFHFNILEKFVDVFNEKGRILVDILKNKAGGEAFDVVPYITLYTLDGIMETSMGQKVHAQEDKTSEYVTSLNRIQEIITTRVFNPLLRNKWIFSATNLKKEHDKLLEYVNEYCMKVMRQRRFDVQGYDMNKLKETDDVGKKKRLAFLDLLLAGQASGNGFTDKDILDEVNTFLFAGHDTTSTAISFAIYNLAKNQDIQQKVYEEIFDLFGNAEDEMTLKELQRTQYLDMVIKESLRMYPPVSSYSRMLVSDLKLTNYTIPAGTSLACLVHVLHRNPETYPQPEVFNPENFSQENTKERHPYAFVPFSAGPRNCIGQKYAMVEIKATLIEILLNFKILPGKDINWLQTHIILVSNNGINVRLEKRK